MPIDRRANSKPAIPWFHLVGLVSLLALVAACGESAQKAPPPGVPSITAVTAECSNNVPVRVISWSTAEGATTYRLLRNGEHLTELEATANTYTDATPAESGEVLTYVVRAVNATGTRDSEPHEFTVPATECGEPGGDPEGSPPKPVESLQVHVYCDPFGMVLASWEASSGATSYTLLQGDTNIHQEAEPEGTTFNVRAELAPGVPFEFVVQAHNEAGTVSGPVTVPDSPQCASEQVLLVASYATVLMFGTDNNVWGWGANYGSVLGSGPSRAPKPQLAPTMPSPITKVLMRNSVAVAPDVLGRVYVWGTSYEGRLAKPGVTHIPEPQPVDGLQDIVDVAMGEEHILALDTTGRVWIWGTFLGRRIEQPERVPLAEGIIRIAAGNDTSYALRTDGTVLAWGSNQSLDVLGHATAADYPEPLLVPGIEGAVQIHAAHRSMFFLRDDGSVASLGESFLAEPVPGVSERPELPRLNNLSIEYDFVLGVNEQGEVLSWGNNDYGQLGRPTRAQGHLEPPRVVEGLPPVRAVFAGGTYSVAVDLSGQVHVWGNNASHQLGLDGVPEVKTFTPVTLPEQAVAVEAGASFVLALGVSGKVYSWGANQYGQLGRTAIGHVDWHPGEVENLPVIVQVAAGENFALALDETGRVHAWGYGANGALGNGPPTSAFRQIPAAIPGLFNIGKVAAGRQHAVALSNGGHIYTWGAGTYGALGHGDLADRDQPRSVFIADTVVNDIAAGDSFTLFLGNGSFVGGFGLNDRFQLGDAVASGGYEPWPVAIAISLVGLDHVFAGVSTGFVVNGFGELLAWGANYGCIKGYCSAAAPDLEQVSGISDVVMVGASYSHALILDGAQGAVYGVGSNFQGQLGLPNDTAYNGPEQVPLTGTVTHVSTGSLYSALVMDGAVHVAGRNAYGEQARAPLTPIPFPVMVDAPAVAVSSMSD